MTEKRGPDISILCCLIPSRRATPEQPPIFKRRNHRKFHRQLHDSQFAPRRKVGLRGTIKAAGSIIGGRPKNPCETRGLSCSVPSAAAKTAALADKIAARRTEEHPSELPSLM